MVSHKSIKSQRSAFKPVAKKRSDNAESKKVVVAMQLQTAGVTKSNEKQVTDLLQDNVNQSNNSNCLTPEDKNELQKMINNSASDKAGPQSQHQSQ